VTELMGDWRLARCSSGACVVFVECGLVRHWATRAVKKVVLSKS
jgi:hypothetical protein